MGLEIGNRISGRKLSINFEVISENFRSSCRVKRISDVVDIEIEQQTPNNTTLWYTAGYTAGVRETGAYANMLESIGKK